MSAKTQAGRVILVTGASRGIGAAAARALAARGAHVIALARTQGGLVELDDDIRRLGGAATLAPADLRSGEAADQLAGVIADRWGRLDGLLGNAGLLGALSPVGHLEPKTWEETMAVNVTANYRLIRALEPLLKASPAGRAAFVSSGAARGPRAYWGLYCASKAALEALVLSWADETASSALRVNLFNPGPARTAMRAKAFPGEDPATLPTPEEVAEPLVALLEPAETRHGALVHFRERRPASSGA